MPVAKLNQYTGSELKYAIDIRKLTKNYNSFSLKGISFQVPMGSIMGLVGENGAGKTTTIKAILGLIHMDEGEISVLGEPANNLTHKLKSQIGVVFDGSSLHDGLKITEINLIMKNFYRNWDEACFYEYMKRFDLPLKKRLKEFSRGMKMKLSIGIALSHQSKLLILDEATSGLDPMVRNEILDVFLEFIQDEEHSILLSTHIISDVEKIADYVTFIHKGDISFCESKDNLLYQYGILHCRKEDVSAIDKNYVVGIRENSFGAEVMIKDKEAYRRRHPQHVVEKTSIEEIMLFVSRGRGQS